MDSKEAIEIALHSLQRIEHSLKEIEANSKQADSEVWHIKRDDGQKVTVLIRCNIISVGEIDTVKQEFSTELWLSASWKEPSLVGKKREEVVWDDQWHPRLVFFNAVSIDKMETKHHLNEDEDSDDGVPLAFLNIRMKATFKEPMELYDFPFDCQDLTIRIMSDWPATDLEFTKNMTIKDSIRRDTFTGAQEWHLCKHVMSRPVEEDAELTGSHRRYPLYHVTAHVKRRVGFYLWNVALIMFLIVCMTFASFSVEPSQPADRLSVTLTLLLTSVAFKFVVSQSLPTISYLTILDKYIIFCMTFQCLMVVQNATASVFTDGDDAKLFDLVCIICLAALVVVAHLSFCITAAFKVRVNNKEMNAADQKYKELCQKINENWEKNKEKRKKREELKSQQQNVVFELNYIESDHHEVKRKKHKRSKVRPNAPHHGDGSHARSKDSDKSPRHDDGQFVSTKRQGKANSEELDVPV